MKPAFSALDPVLAALAPILPGRGDLLLDLRSSAQSAPGRCIRCYFQLLASTPVNTRPRLTPLRAWLEARIEVAAHDDGGHLLETLPVLLANDDSLESYCRRSMRIFGEDRALYSSSIQLGFRYRSSATPATAA